MIDELSVIYVGRWSWFYWVHLCQVEQRGHKPYLTSTISLCIKWFTSKVITLMQHACINEIFRGGRAVCCYMRWFPLGWLQVVVLWIVSGITLRCFLRLSLHACFIWLRCVFSTCSNWTLCCMFFQFSLVSILESSFTCASFLKEWKVTYCQAFPFSAQCLSSFFLCIMQVRF